MRGVISGVGVVVVSSMDEGEEEGGGEVERGQRSFSRFNSYDGHERTNAPTRGAALQRSDSLVSVSSDSLLPIGRRSLVVTTEDMVRSLSASHLLLYKAERKRKFKEAVSN